MSQALAIDLAGRIVVITGATGDLGRVMTRTLAACGADICIHYHRNGKQAEALRGEVLALGRRACLAQGDVSSKADMIALRDTVTRELGPADIVIANAVVQYQWKHVLEQDPADYESQFRSCVLHAVNLAQAFSAGMIAKGRGRFIGLNSECAMQNDPNQSAYVSGKRGMDGVLRVLAKEIGQHGITVNQVAPGYMVSDRNRAVADSEIPWYREKIPLRRRGTDQDVANTVAFLASDLASFITGAYLPVCGGNVMPCI